MLESKNSFTSKLVTTLILSISNLFCTKIFLNKNFEEFIRLFNCLINLKLSWFVMSTKNIAHWYSYKNVSFDDGSLRNSSSKLTSYIFKSKDLDWSKPTDILVVTMAIMDILYNEYKKYI